MQEPLDIDLTSSGAVLIDIRRRFQDIKNITKRLAVKGIEGISSERAPSRVPSLDRAQQDNAYRDDADYLNETTRAWARDGTPEAQSQRSANVIDSENSDEDEDDPASARYTFFPHRHRHGRQPSTTSGESH